MELPEQRRHGARPSSGPWPPLRAAELLALYLGLPAILFVLGEGGARPWILVPLLVLGALGLGLLLRMSRFDRRVLVRWAPAREVWRVLLLFALAVPALAALSHLLEPGRMFHMPHQAPVLFLAFLLIYPPLAALPQELLFRVWLVERYGELLSGPRLRVALSALLFAYAHLIYLSVPAMLLSLAGGALFAFTYERTRSLLLVSFEHSLYGLAVFTLGLERHFMHPMWLDMLP